MSDEPIKLVLALATGRSGRVSEKVANFVFSEISKDSRFESKFLDIRDFPLTFSISSDEDNNLAKKWREIVNWSDILVFVAPEYNRGFPGELKILLDCAFEEYKGKVSGICSVSSGKFGGVRMAEVLRGLLVYLGMRPVRTEIPFPLVETEFSNDLPQNIDFYKSQIVKMLDEAVSLV